ncbi:MAG: DUF4065 domain-containing protein [bacterium]|nr:DUF4065 domain-containing protein [bacterium]
MATFLKKLRCEQGISQGFMAEKIGLSRPTYAKIENGKRGMSLKEAQKLADFFGISFEDLRQGRNTVISVEMQRDKEQLKKEKQEIRISVPQKNIKKFKEVLLYVLEKIGARPNIGETAIYKLFYFIDFDYYEKYEEQLIGAVYIKNLFGPTPVEFKKITDEMIKNGEIEKIKSKYFQHEQKKYLPRRKANLNILSAQEIQHIDEVIARLAWKNATELSNYSHSDTPWRVHKMGEKISYESVFYRDNDHSVRNYDDEL